MSEEPEWRVGTKVPRNIYFKNEPTAVAVGAKPEADRVAAGIVAMMNARLATWGAGSWAGARSARADRASASASGNWSWGARRMKRETVAGAGFADALADLVWVVLGTAVEAGIPFDAVWAEVRRANMAKAGGVLDASGKLQKPPGWTPPDIAGVLEGVASSTRRASPGAAGGSSRPGVDGGSGAEHFRQRFERVG